MTKTGKVSLNADRKEQLKRRVWDVAQKLMQRIEDGTVNEKRFGNFEFAVSTWMDETGWGLWPIFPSDWEALVETNELTDVGIDEMIHEGLDYYFEIEKPLEGWDEDDEDED